MFKADEIIEKRDRERGREGEREARVSAVRAPDHCGSAQMRFYMPTNLNYIFFFLHRILNLFPGYTVYLSRSPSRFGSVRLYAGECGTGLPLPACRLSLAAERAS